jgi:hypothetical protein
MVFPLTEIFDICYYSGTDVLIYSDFRLREH